jgi:hypothetical protein
VSKARDRLSTALEEKLTKDQLAILLDEVLAVTKNARAYCPECRHHVNVQVNDAKAVAGALTDLLVQAEGRPREASTQPAGIIFTRKIFYSGERDEAPE